MSRTSRTQVPRTIVLERCRSTATSAEARFRVGSTTATVRFDGVAPVATSVPEAFAAIARVMGMETHQRILSLAPIGRSFRAQIDTFQGVHLALFPDQAPAPILAPPRRERPPRREPDGRRVAAFFSGGVDSVALVADRIDAIDDLIFMRGFDVALEDRERSEEVLGFVRAAAEEVGKPLMVIDTDVRAFTNPYTDWTWFVYGPIMATAILLERTHHTVLCAASVADRHLPPEAVRLRGTGFGNEYTRLHIEGRRASRVEKIAAIAASGLARTTLRVCYQDVPGTVNCGVCTKCIRTTAALAATGGLGSIASLPTSLDLDAVATLPAVTRSDRAYLTEIGDVARTQGRNDLVGALEKALAASPAAP